MWEALMKGKRKNNVLYDNAGNGSTELLKSRHDSWKASAQN